MITGLIFDKNFNNSVKCILYVSARSVPAYMWPLCYLGQSGSDAYGDYFHPFSLSLPAEVYMRAEHQREIKGVQSCFSAGVDEA